MGRFLFSIIFFFFSGRSLDFLLDPTDHFPEPQANIKKEDFSEDENPKIQDDIVLENDHNVNYSHIPQSPTNTTRANSISFGESVPPETQDGLSDIFHNDNGSQSIQLGHPLEKPDLCNKVFIENDQNEDSTHDRNFTSDPKVNEIALPQNILTTQLFLMLTLLLVLNEKKP